MHPKAMKKMKLQGESGPKSFYGGRTSGPPLQVISKYKLSQQCNFLSPHVTRILPLFILLPELSRLWNHLSMTFDNQYFLGLVQLLDLVFFEKVGQ